MHTGQLVGCLVQGRAWQMHVTIIAKTVWLQDTCHTPQLTLNFLRLCRERHPAGRDWVFAEPWRWIPPPGALMFSRAGDFPGAPSPCCHTL